MPITLTVTATVKMPEVPGYFYMSDNGIMRIEDITDEGLREIGEAWTDELIATAQRIRVALPDTTPAETPDA